MADCYIIIGSMLYNSRVIQNWALPGNSVNHVSLRGFPVIFFCSRNPTFIKVFLQDSRAKGQVYILALLLF
jgi:hypothetical protein